MDYSKLVVDYLDSLKEKQVSFYTIKNYSHYLNEFLSFNKTNLPVTDELIVRYRQHLGKKELKKETKNYYLIALRNLCRYNNMDLEIKLEPHHRPEKNLLSKDDIQKLINIPKGKNQLRDKIILACLAYGKMKVSDLVSLNKANIPKLPNDSMELIKAYLRTRDDQDPALFVRTKGKGNNWRLTSRSVERIVKKYSQAAGLAVSATPEVLKNSGQNS